MEEEILGTFLQLENTNEKDLALVAPKQKNKLKCRKKPLFCSTNQNLG